MKNILSFHNYFKKELTYFFYAISCLGLMGNVIDLIAFTQSWNPIFFYYNLVTVISLIITVILFRAGVIRLKTGFIVWIYSIFVNLIVSNITDIILGEIYYVYLLREALFVCFLLTVAFLMVDRIHGLVIGTIFLAYFTFSSLYSHDDFLITNLPNILILFTAYVLVLSFFQTYLNKAIVRSQEDTFLIKEQYEELSVINQELTAVNEELHESQKQINAQHEELITLSESLSHQNKELEVKNNKLEEAIHQKTKLFSIIAHDLKSPILSTSSLTELLLERYDTMSEEKKINWLNKILNSNKLLYELLENLLLWSRSQTGMIELKPETLNLAGTVEKIASIYRNYASNKSIHLSLQIEQGLTLYADRMMIETIIRNFLSNAIKFSFENGTITIRASNEGHYTIVSVEDDGVGMRPQQLQTLFNSGNNSVTTGTLGEKGTGLGLRICCEFIEKHEGRIWAESESEKGTTISFSLPRAVRYRV
jgi:signal transduction histidine kinase